jgi:DNA processing protein
VAVIGTRQASAHGREAYKVLAGDLARNGVTVVSGLARGIDGIAHAAALDAGGRTIAVLGSGLDRIYPVEHLNLARRILDSGALISEFPLDARPDAHNFPRRNRILSASLLGTLCSRTKKSSRCPDQSFRRPTKAQIDSSNREQN